MVEEFYYIDVTIPAALDQLFTYRSVETIPSGTRVQVKFRSKDMIGVAMRSTSSTERPAPSYEVLPIVSRLDEKPIFNPKLMDLARWISSYYFCPLGEVLKAMIPATSLKEKKNPTRVRKNKRGSSEADAMAAPLPHKALTQEQQDVFKSIKEEGLYPMLAGKPVKPMLLFGVTGSGKTEIYLQTIHELLAKEGNHAQILVLVPEISLTPQTVRSFTQRYPGKVSVVHSQMSNAKRWKELSHIMAGRTNILIGPRSAVFAPFCHLKLIIVDEEHDSSYKQNNKPAYHARDVAIFRARLENACVILGSATPALESYFNAKEGKYHFLTLSQRVHNRPLPEVEILPKIFSRQGFTLSKEQEDLNHTIPELNEDSEFNPIDPKIIKELGLILNLKQQAIVLVNRRGYAYYILNTSNKEALECPHCSISLTLHKGKNMLRCHYCDYRIPLTEMLQKHEGQKLIAFGQGSQKTEDLLKSYLKDASIVRLDSDTTQKKDYLADTINAFKEGAIDILVGTQLLAKGHDFPNVTLIVLLEIDQLLSFPDFRAGEKTFQLLVQSAGRAGRGDLPGKVLLQTAFDTHPVILCGIHHDYLSFAQRELEERFAFHYPPYSRMIILEFSSIQKDLLDSYTKVLATWLEKFFHHFPVVHKNLKILGPTTPSIEVIRGRHRKTLLFQSTDLKILHTCVKHVISHKPRQPSAIRLYVDVDPQNLA